MDEWLKKLKKTNAKLVNLIVLAIGVILIFIGMFIGLTKVFGQAFLSIGTSLIASSIVVFVTTRYLLEQNRINDLIEKWGLNEIYETRAIMNKDSNKILSMEKDKLDIIAFGLKSFRDSQGDLLKEKVHKGLKIRIITMFPNSIFLEEREKCENEAKGQMKKTIIDLIGFVENLQKIQTNTNQVQIKVYNSLPLDFYFGFKSEIFIGPYMYNKGSQQTISYSYKANSLGFKYYSDYFDKLWGDEKFTKPFSEVNNGF